MGMQGMGSNGLGMGGQQQQIPPGLMQMLMQHQQQGGGMMPTAPQIGQGGPMAPQLPGPGGPQDTGGMMPQPNPNAPTVGPGPVGAGQAMGANLPLLLMALKGGQNGLQPQGQQLPAGQNPNAMPGQPGYLQLLLQHLQGNQGQGTGPGPFVPGTGQGAGGMT